MAYVNTGYERAFKITIYKTVGGVPALGYTDGHTYDMRTAFLSYSAITDPQAKRLSIDSYNTRWTAFLAFIEEAEAGFDKTTDITNSRRVSNPAGCVPPPTTTTTTAAPTTTTTLAPTTTSTTAAPTTTTTLAPTTTSTTTV